MATQNESAPESLIAGAFAVLVDRPLPDAGGGLPAFAVADTRSGRGGLMAVQAQRAAPPRAQVMSRLSSGAVDGVVAPVAHGPASGPAPGPDGALAWFVVCEAPPGAPLWPAGAVAGTPWREAELLDRVLRPAAAALERLQARHVTHRAIRPDNIFRSGPGENVVLGCAWAGAPGLLQPAIFEPPTSAACLPQGRGEGSIADDIYALGVTLLCLAIGRVPLAGLDDRAILRRKLELGSYAALAGEERLPPVVADIIRGMLAEDPDHRPAPALLADPAAARNRRVAARPVTRAQAPLETESGPVWNLRMLAQAIAAAPEAGVRLLRNGSIDRWLRRSLGDSPMAMRLEELRRQRAGGQAGEDARADATVAMMAVAMLDPLAPCAWQGLQFWPDGLGPVLADPPLFAARSEALFDLLDSEAIASWGMLRAERSDPMSLRQDAHRMRGLLRQRGWGGGLARLRYSLNPLLACDSALVRSRLVVRLGDVLAAMEAASARADPAALPLDADFAAFLAARHEARMDSEIAQLVDGPPERAAVAQLRLIGLMQRRGAPVALPGLAGWLRRHVEPALAIWRNAQRRRAMAAALDEMTRAGNLHGMLALLEDSAALEADAAEAAAAARQVAAITERLTQLGSAAGIRADAARRAGHDTVLGVAMCGMAIAAVAAVLG
jgi:hypothetical protein